MKGLLLGRRRISFETEKSAAYSSPSRLIIQVLTLSHRKVPIFRGDLFTDGKVGLTQTSTFFTPLPVTNPEC